MKINVGVSSGIMHIRKKTVERCEVEYEVAEEVIPMASIWEFKSAKSANIENPRNINPVKIVYSI